MYPSPPSVRVVRFATSGLREAHELAVCEHCVDGNAKLWFADRVVDTTSKDVEFFHIVNEKTFINKATVHYAVHADLDALRAGVPTRFHQVRATRREPPRVLLPD